MNTGIISRRYARALLLLTQETGRGEQVCNQIRSLLSDPDRMPENLEPDLEKIIALLAKNGREGYLKFVLNSFVGMYYRSVNVVPAHLTTAVPAPGLAEKLAGIVLSRTGFKIALETAVDPDIVGGFIFDIDDYRLDASIRSSIDAVRRQFIENNKRLV